MTRMAALVPMRHHSERVPEKNFRPLAGRPLYSYILETLLQVEAVEAVVVDTDSPVIKAGLAADFPSVIVLDRPESLRAPDVPMNDVILWDIQQVPAEHYVQTHSTNPLLTAETIARGLDQYFDSLGLTRFALQRHPLAKTVVDAGGGAPEPRPGRTHSDPESPGHHGGELLLVCLLAPGHAGPSQPHRR